MEKTELVKEITSLVYKECKSVPPGIKYKIGLLVEKFSPTPIAPIKGKTSVTRSTSTKKSVPTRSVPSRVVAKKQEAYADVTTFPKREWPKMVTSIFKTKLRSLVKNGRKLEAVKELKGLTGMDLKIAKDLIDSL